ETVVPPCSSYSYGCSEKSTPRWRRNCVAGVSEMCPFFAMDSCFPFQTGRHYAIGQALAARLCCEHSCSPPCVAARCASRVTTPLATWMMLRMQFFQPLSGHMRINLGGGDIGVPEQHLHHAQVRAVVEQVGGKGMAQRVR